MASSKFGEKLEELDLSHEEIDRLTTCMKDEKFRDLLREYAEEISDPENRKRYEEEIAMLERDRGMDVKFINPKPGHVLKTSIDGSQKCFINICTNENLGQPKSKPSVQGSTRGMQWSIPHSVSQAREDVDKVGTKCIVYDVVFHPDTYYLLQKNERFKKMIHDTALDAIERQFHVKLDKVNVRTPKMTFKGLPMSSVIRTPNPNRPPSSNSAVDEDVDPRLRLPPHPTEVKHSCNGTDSGNKVDDQEKATAKKKILKHVRPLAKKNEDGKDYIKPDYNITHRGHFDIQDFRIAPGSVHNTRPKELVIHIDLPLLSAANSVNLEIFEKRLHLDSEKPAKYKLDFELPYPVAESKEPWQSAGHPYWNELTTIIFDPLVFNLKSSCSQTNIQKLLSDLGFAKFDKSRHCLTVTLEVLPPPPKLAPFTSTPSLVTQVEDAKKCDKKKKSEETALSICSTTEVDVPPTNESIKKIGIKQSTKGGDINEATEVTSEAVLTNIATPPKGNYFQQPEFVEEGRRHYQEGSKWKNSECCGNSKSDLKEETDKSPLTKNSAFLIDMVMKYEGLIRRCPQYAFHQDDHYVCFVIEVPHIFEESLWYVVYENLVQFCCLSECLDDDMVNSVFQLWIEFGDNCLIEPQRSRVDVSANNAVFCLRKSVIGVEWQCFKAGFDKENLDTRRFSTEKTVSELYTLVFKHAEGVSTTPLAVCKAIQKDKDLVVIDFEEAKNNSNAAHNNTKKQLQFIHQTTSESKENGSSVKTSEPQHADAKLPKQSNKASFSNSVQTNVARASQTEGQSRDSDDDDEEVGKGDGGASPAQGLITITNSDESKEVVANHVTKSAVKLASDSLIFELDDDV